MAALRVSGRGVDLGEALRTRVEERISAALAKYFDGAYHGHVTVARDGAAYRTDCVLHLPSGITLEASGTAHDAHASFDQTAERIEKRLRRYKHRLKAHPNGHAKEVGLDGGLPGSLPGREAVMEAAYSVFEAPEEDTGEHPPIIAESTRTLHRRTVSEAVVELDLTGVPVLVFVHAGTERVNVVYRRGDGAIGWIDPPERGTP
ncbi:MULTISPECIES: ribosome-associated translation inhibitor RaiA [Methylobacterium]|jgi:ribosomal subunit interface protein|uniref:Ribosome hibernation promoting factor n=2 Tax=Methylobacterium TaxID=407 RepID=A0A0C6FFF6_9HYPH|nr:MULTISPECIES: ribosome-associated translation inhibitor RaiA [Methylobacterium]MBK3396244.1 ribosome-associated translation inhibitor RaiA [Methylobacterium ajmalii]MBK3410073.1 ribosome-associated translation inhibitor RaiA [Methylobacterium ajmalii]MBK3421301.1 ribosome-associated translation inhibitor RaiA [Methylobacterium ajmalii]MBZ6411708.1 ribosome-associated translation inhibitor RaiA [Methylobacterium sp.]SEP13314.1 SSU ribosomal protein S30P/sigma 54 modulation protein [Methyloba